MVLIEFPREETGYMPTGHERSALRHSLIEIAEHRPLVAIVDAVLRDGPRTLDLGGGRSVLFANLGPAHSGHDLVALVPGALAA